MQTFPNLEANPDTIQVEYIGPKTSIRKTIYSGLHRGIAYGRFLQGDKFLVYRDDVEIINRKQVVLKIIETEKPKTTRRKRRTKKEAA